MAYTEPVAEVISVRQEGDVATVALKICRQLHAPIAPAGLYDQLNPAREIFQLHKLIEESKRKIIFETYNSDKLLPAVGEKFIFRSWWILDALEAVQDTKVKWVRKPYPDNGGHDHCMLTWADISTDAENREGYHSKYGWITVEAYDKFIKQDVLRLRKALKK